MLDINNLSIGFKDIKVVEDVNLHLSKKDKLAIIGETGSGKSMLIMSIINLVSQEAKIEGEILYEGRNIFDLAPREMEALRGSQISYIGQGSGNGLNPLLKIGYQVCEVDIEKNKLPLNRAMEKSLGLLKKFNVGNEENIIRSYPHTLSGGMKQRVMVAMGISGDPEIILADEPTKGLDGKRIQMVVEAFKALEDKTLVCVTHDIRFAQEISTRICLMYAGEQLEISSREDFFQKPLHPYGQAMIQALPENGLQANSGFAPPRDDKCWEGCKFYSRCEHRTERCRIHPPMIDYENSKVRCWLYDSRS